MLILTALKTSPQRRHGTPASRGDALSFHNDGPTLSKIACRWPTEAVEFIQLELKVFLSSMCTCTISPRCGLNVIRTRTLCSAVEDSAWRWLTRRTGLPEQALTPGPVNRKERFDTLRVLFSLHCTVYFRNVYKWVFLLNWRTCPAFGKLYFMFRGQVENLDRGEWIVFVTFLSRCLFPCHAPSQAFFNDTRRKPTLLCAGGWTLTRVSKGLWL